MLQRIVGKVFGLLSGPVLGLLIAGTAGSAEANTINYSVELFPFNHEFQGVNYSFAGGTLTGVLDISSTPDSVYMNPTTGQEESHFLFTGTATVNGAPLTFQNFVGSHYNIVAVYRNPDSTAFHMRFEPFKVSDNLYLFGLYFQDNLGYSWPYTYLNYGVPGLVTFGAYAGNFEITPVLIPATLPLFAAGLGVLGLIAGRSKRKAALD